MPAELARAITDRASGQFGEDGIGCAPQILDPGRADAVSGPSASCGMIVACSRWPDRPSVSCRPGRPRCGLAQTSAIREAENRFLRGELALYQQSGLMPRRVYAATRVCPRTVRNHAHAIVAVIE